LFGFQGEAIVAQPLVIALLAVPILIQVYFNAGRLAVAPLRRCMVRGGGRADRRVQLLRAGRRGRHLAVRLTSGAALATVVGVLVEVPVMLSVVSIVKASRAGTSAVRARDRPPRHVSRAGRWMIWPGALAAAKLPTVDLAEPGRAFVRFDDDAGLVGFGGIEAKGRTACSARWLSWPITGAAGIGRAMLALLEGEAPARRRAAPPSDQHRSAVLQNGYAGVDRAAAPPTVAASREFTALCPASATYLVKAL
jgi:amino-acid N-acetyltransferase